MDASGAWVVTETPDDLVDAVVAACRDAGWRAPEGSWQLRVSSRRLQAGTKLGLGSSGAVAAGVASLFGPDGATPAEVQAVALAGHDRFQGGAGSGADVLASLWGGVSRMEGRRVEPMPATCLDGLQWAAIFTGVSADTRVMIAALRAWAANDAGAWAAHRDGLVSIAHAGAAALAAGDGSGWLAAVKAYGEVEEALTVASGVEIVSAPVARALAAARSCGWVAKPSGAGGGDLVVAFAVDGADRRALEAAVDAAGLRTVPLAVASAGAFEARRRAFAASVDGGRA